MSICDSVFWVSIALGAYLVFKLVIWDIGYYVIRLHGRNPILAKIAIAAMAIALFLILTGFDSVVRMYLGLMPTRYGLVTACLLGGWTILAVYVHLFPYFDRYLGHDDVE